MKIMERIYDATTGETTDVERELTAAEVKTYQAAEAEAAKRQAEAEAAIATKTAAEAKLAALGLSVEDLKALGL
jgi:hypothetical protein